MYRTGENFGLLTFIAKRKGRKAEMVKEWLQSRKEERRKGGRKFRVTIISVRFIKMVMLLHVAISVKNY